MKKIKLPKFTEKLVKFTIDKSPEILAIIAVGGVIDTARRAYKCRPKCDEIIAMKKKKLENIAQNDTAARRKVYLDTAKEIVPVVAPVLIMGGITIASIIFSHHITKKRIIALTAAYNLAGDSLKELQNKMNEVLGENKVRDIRDKIMNDKIMNDKIDEEEIIQTGDGDTLCYDSFTGRYFRSSALKIGQAINEISSDVMREMYVVMNDFYSILHLPEVEAGMNMGWRSEDAIRGSLPITFSAHLTPKNEPCLCLDYNNSLTMV